KTVSLCGLGGRAGAVLPGIVEGQELLCYECLPGIVRVRSGLPGTGHGAASCLAMGTRDFWDHSGLLYRYDHRADDGAAAAGGLLYPASQLSPAGFSALGGSERSSAATGLC